MKHPKRDLHMSSFTFTSFSEPLENPQKDLIYSYESEQMRQGMQDEVRDKPTQTKFYNNQYYFLNKAFFIAPINTKFLSKSPIKNL